jgi:hypothetical protein
MIRNGEVEIARNLSESISIKAGHIIKTIRHFRFRPLGC